MGSIAETNRYRMAFSEETVWNETPSSPAMTELPLTKQGLGTDKGTKRSNRIRNDYNPGKVIQISQGAGGVYEFELEYNTFQKPFEHLLRADTTVISISETTISFDAATQVIADSGGDAFAACKIGMWIKFSGAYNSENNGIFRITAVAALGANVTVANGDSAIVDESAGETIVGAVSNLRNGTTKKSCLLEQQFLDVSEYIYYPGNRTVAGSLQVASNDILTGSFTMLGRNGIELAASIAGSTTAASIAMPMSSGVSVGDILLDGVAASISIKSLSVDIAGSERLRPQVHSLYTNDIGLGTILPSGSMEVYFEDEIFYDMYRDHTAFALSWRATDSDGNIMVFTLPENYLVGGKPDFGKDEDVILPMTFESSDVTSDGVTYCLQIDQFAA